MKIVIEEEFDGGSLAFVPVAGEEWCLWKNWWSWCKLPIASKMQTLRKMGQSKMKNQISKVILLGGAPMTGKTTIARIIASQLKYGCLSTDDLGEAISSVTKHETHPEFHYMNGLDYRQYYIEKSENELKEDILNQHKAIWPAIERLIQIHSTWSTPIVIEGWAIHPEFIRNLKNVISPLFLVAPNTVIEKRIIENDFSKGSTDEGEMRRKYKARSIWFNEKIIAETNRLNMKVFENKQEISPEEIAEEIIENGFLEKI